MPSRHYLQRCAIAVSIFSLFYNTAEGVVSILFGAESSSRALIFYGLQSAVEVISDLLVAWRFLSVSGSADGTENPGMTPPKFIQIERIATIIIGALLAALTVAAVATSAASLAAHDHPSTTIPAILIAATSTGVSLLLYLAKRYLARALNSSTLNGEALCALCCTELSTVLLIGSLIYRVWDGGWWVDSATAVVIALMFGWEGFKMIRWARNKDFDGGCCASPHSTKDKEDSDGAKCTTPPSVTAEKSSDEPQPNPTTPCSSSSSSQCCGCPRKEKIVDGNRV